MTSTVVRSSGKVGASALAVTLLLAGPALVAVSHGPALPPHIRVPWWSLIPLFVAAHYLHLGFQRRDSNVLITLSQVPLALGVVLVAPDRHLLARLLAAAAVALVARNRPLKAGFNVGAAGLEVGVAALAVSVVAPMQTPGPHLWAALFVGLLGADLAVQLALLLLFRLLHTPLTRRQLVEPLVVALLTSGVFAGLAVLTISAAWTDASTLLVVAALAVALALGYRAHQRLVVQQQATEDLYALVKDLGPVDVEHPDALKALERVRELVHARHLGLTAIDARGVQGVHLSVHLDAEPETSSPSAVDTQAVHGGLQDDCMTTPLLVQGAVIGLLTARHRVGCDRGFDMGDLRLLETVANELGTALDRGRMLRDLGRAATTDSLTGLPNLRRTEEQIDALLVGRQVLLAAVAVDSFREVNDTLGHLVGDDLLREVADRLAHAVPGAVVGRIGGGRFAIAVPAELAGDDAAMFGLHLRTRVEGGVQLGAVGTHVRLSVGCVRAPEHGRDAGTLLRRAETAMYSARRAHGGPVLWEPAYEVKGQRRLAVVMALREALSSGAIGVAFQPKTAVSDGRVTGVEALARWTHPALGSITPAEFVPLAEASGLMGPLTSSVLRQALTACKGWQRRGGEVGVAVNVSADTVLDQTFVTEVAAVLAAVDVRPGLLTLELTEDVVVADPELAVERMNELRALGVRLSVDDFGTGYSSLTYLKGLPIDEVKIDKGFVDGIVDDPADQAVIRAVVDIAHTLGMTVVVEGVEQESQQALLRRLGVDELQGYLHARPMPALDMAAWLRRRELARH